MTPYAKEIIAVILLKLILLTVLWAVCFQSPIEHKLNRDDLETHWLR